MENPYLPPRSALHAEAEPPSRLYDLFSLLFGALAMLLLIGAILSGAWDYSPGSLLVTALMLQPCATAAALRWGRARVQVLTLVLHGLGALALIMHGVKMVLRDQPPPELIVVFGGFCVLHFFWSLRQKDARSHTETL